MTDAMLDKPITTPVRRPGPGHTAAPGLQVAPPVLDGFAPWVAILEQPENPGELRWEVGPDGVLLPTRHTADADGVRSKGRALRGWLAGLRG